MSQQYVVTCTCGQRMRVGEEHFGKTGKCVKCRKPITVTRESVTPIGALSAPAPKGASTRSVEDKVPAEWNPGDVILDLYEVKGVLGQGGMGRVYRVHHKGWNVDLAVKCPLAESFRTQAQRDNFVRECETWVNLGLHPHTVSCYYVRTLGGIPRVFAEYVEGGTLEQWITSGKLYEGGKEKALERILDIAIQFAWGLQYAHEQGLIHQDVKPANVMMTTDGTAKVTDFGLANARAVAGADVTAQPGTRSIMASYGGMTPAYCSPEQADNAARHQAGTPREQLTKLTRATDIYSWAVSVFEMFNGGVSWLGGNVAGESLRQYLESGPAEEYLPNLPPNISELLAASLKSNPDARLQDFSLVTPTLLSAYQEAMRVEYHRDFQQNINVRADSLNNMALSSLDLGDPVKARSRFDDALADNPTHPQATFNRGLMMWRNKEATDEDLLTRLREVQSSHPQDPTCHYLLGLAHIERTDTAAALDELEKATATSEDLHARLALSGLKTMKSGLPIRVATFTSLIGGRVQSLGLTSDGDWLLSKSGISYELWDVKNGQCTNQFELDLGPNIVGACVCSGGKLAAAIGGCENTIHVLDLEKGAKVGELTGHHGGVSAAAFSANGRWFASAGGTPIPWDARPGQRDFAIRVWDVSDRRLLHEMQGHNSGVTGIKFHPDSMRILSASADTTLRMWDATTGTCLSTISNSTSPLALSPCGRLALCCSQSYFGEVAERTIRLIDLTTGEHVQTFQTHARHNIASLSFLPRSNQFLSLDLGGKLKSWDIYSGRCKFTFDFASTYFAAPDDGQIFACVDSSGEVGIWNNTTEVDHADSSSQVPWVFCRIRSSTEELELRRKTRSLLAQGELEIASDNVSAACRVLDEVCSAKTMARSSQVLDFRNRILLKARLGALRGAWQKTTLRQDCYEVHYARHSCDGRQLLLGSDNKLELLDIKGRTCASRCQTRLVCPGVGGGQVTFWGYIGRDGNWALASYHQSIQCWRFSDSAATTKFLGHTGTVWQCAVSNDERILVSASDDSTVRVWDIHTGVCIRKVEKLGHWFGPIALSPDMSSVASSYCHPGSKDDQALIFLDLASGNQTHVINVQSDVRGLDISPDGSRVVTGHRDGLVQIWNVDSGTRVCQLEGHKGEAKSLRFLRDGTKVFSAGGDGVIRLWDVNSASCVAELLGHPGYITSLSLSRDSRYLVSAGFGGYTIIWELEWEVEVRDRSDWDEGARRYLVNFLTLHTPFVAPMPTDHQPTDEEVTLALTRRGKPIWTDDDFKQLLYTLACAGYGWLRPEGVRKELEKMAATWDGPPPLA